MFLDQRNSIQMHTAREQDHKVGQNLLQAGRKMSGERKKSFSDTGED